MNVRSFSRWSVMIASIVLLVASTNFVKGEQFNLGTLIDEQGSITAGDKIFYGFGLQSLDFSASNVSVIALSPGLDGNLGLRFQSANWVAVDSNRDFTLSYSVATLSGEPLITDVHMTLGGVATLGSGRIIASEDVYDSAGGIIGNIQIIHPPQGVQGEPAVFDPQSVVHVVKDINLIAMPQVTYGQVGSTWQCPNVATLSYIDQTFSQVPEPGTALLVMAGLFGAVLTTRRSR